jgi:O-antigen ligase
MTATPSLTLRSAALTAVVVGCAMFAGALVVLGGVLGTAAVLALVYAPLVLLSVPVAIGLWVPVIFFEGLPGATNLPEAGFLLPLLGWLAMARPDSRVGDVLRANRRVLVVLGLFLVWALVTILWAQDRARATKLMPSYIAVALIYVVVLSSLGTLRHIRLFALCFVLGVAASVGVGLAVGDGALGGAFYEDGRLTAGMSDPNFLAVTIVTAIALVAGLLPSTRTLLGRWMLGGVLVMLLLAGLLATQSRGGLVAAFAAVLAMLWLARGRRLRLTGIIGVILVAGGLWLASNPTALERFTAQDKYGGSGRQDLWRLAWREFEEHPIRGVGLDNFAIAASPYLREPGALLGVKHIERGQEAHNLYLGLLAETGIVGLLLYLVIPFASLRAALAAGDRFATLGEHAAAALSRAVAVAIIAALVGAFFLPAAADKRIWVLLALGPALLSVTATTRASSMPGQPGPAAGTP